MRDPRNARLADVIVRHSTQLQPGERVLVEAFDVADGLVLDLVEAVHRVNAIPFVALRSNAVNRALIRGGAERQFQLQAEVELFQMQKVDAYVGLRGTVNSSELSDVPSERMADYARLVMRPV